MEVKHFEIVRHNSFILRNVNANSQLIFWRWLRLLEVSKLNLIDLSYYRQPWNYFKFLVINTLRRRRKIIHGEAVWLIDIWTGNYYHWMVEAIPKLLSTKLDLNQVTVILPLEFKSTPFHVESLRLLNVKFEFFNEVNEHVFCSKVYVPLNVSLGAIANTHFINRIRDHFRSFVKLGNEVKRKIYCSRKFADKRKIVNEVELIEILEKHGFEIVFWEKLTFIQQVSLAAESTFLLALHGAGLTNMIFMAAGSTVFELTRTDENNFCYKYLAHAADLNYLKMECESLSSDIHHADCKVDLVKLENLLTKSI
jgi:capsular polysaccharide biosynthesis protein